MSDFINTCRRQAVYRWAMTTNSELYRTANARLTEVVESVEDWTASSPCTGWTVRDVLDHLIDTERDFLSQHELDAGRRPDTAQDPAGGWQMHSSRVQAILDNPELAETSFDGFFGPTTVGATLARFYGFDLVVHRWDIARGAGVDTQFTDSELDLIEKSLEGFGEHLYMEGICRPALSAPDDASRETRLLARMGRDAQWRPSANA